MRNILNRNFKTQFSLQVVSGYGGYVIWQACLSLVDADALPPITRHRPLFIIPVSIPRPITAMQKSRKLIKENIFRYAHIYVVAFSSLALLFLTMASYIAAITNFADHVFMLCTYIFPT